MATFINPSPLFQPPSPSIRSGCRRSGHVNASRFMPLAPLLGRSSNPSGPTDDTATVDAAIEVRSESIKQSASCFTKEKARQLCRKTVDCYTFHDAMYHSAIASRLASDVCWNLANAGGEELDVSVSPNSEPKDCGILPMQTMYSSRGWDSYSWAFRADNSVMEISVHKPGTEEDPACGPLIQNALETFCSQLDEEWKLRRRSLSVPKDIMGCPDSYQH